MQKLREKLLKRPLGRGAIVIVLTGALILAFAGAFVLHSVLGTSDNIAINGPISTVDAGGLELSLQVVSDPYFLSELLPVRMTLTNNSQKDYLVEGAPSANSCAQTMWATMTGGADPTFPLAIQGIGRCPPPPLNTFHPGQSWSFVQFVPLTASGRVTVTTQSSFATETTTDGEPGYHLGEPGPFGNNWPTLHLSVSPTIPADRIILLTPTITSSHQVGIDAPPAAWSHLYYFYDASCPSSDGQGSEFETNGIWQAISARVLQEPDCSGVNETWQYSVAAPGYAIASGEA